MTLRLLSAFWLLCALTVPSIARAAEAPLADARSLLLAGKYAEAAEIFSPLAEQGDPSAVLGLARCLEAEGKLDEAAQALTAAAGEHAQLHAELARLAFDRGNRQEAQARADEALRLDPNQLLGRWISAELHRTAGRLDEAEREYRWLIRYYNDHEILSAESLRWIGLAASEYARWNRLSDQFHFLIGDLYPDALKLEPDYWPAHYEAGLLYLEKYNQADAIRQFQAALELNPNAAEVHVAVACLAIAGREIDKAQASLARALEINPNLIDAWLTTADLAWANFDPKETLRLLQEKALPLCPTSEETLGRVAACYVLADGLSEPGQSTRFSRLEEEVTSRNPHAGEFYFALAIRLAEQHQRAAATRFFHKAIEVMPQIVGPLANLGLLQMSAGEEALATTTLDQAFEIDPFNLRVSNTLQVLDLLDEMETLETEHFTIRFDPAYDTLWARYAAEHLEEVYPDLCRNFGFEPPGKSLVEVFGSARGAGGLHWISTRLVGLPYIGPLAASTGWIVAMASPGDEQTPSQFDWARVLTHEFVHVITLQQTNFYIPHWYTEGLAVRCEDRPRPAHWNQLLCERVPSGDLFDLDTINFGFTRPNSGADCQMAYCQAELYVDYMLDRWGAEGQQELLAAYEDGLDTPEAIGRAFSVSQEEFEEGYLAFVREVVDEMPTLDYPSEAGLAELLQVHRDEPDNTDAAAELAYAHLRRGADLEAYELIEEVLDRQPKHPLAGYVLARLALNADRTDEAVEALKNCLDEQSPQPNVLELLAALKLKAGDYDEAARLYSLGERLDVVHPNWTRSLARVYLLAKDNEQLAEVLARLARSEVYDLTIHKKLAQLALDREDYVAAADWANQALHIDITDAEVHRQLAEALVGREDFAGAIDEFEIAVELQPAEPDVQLALARVCIQGGQQARARDVLNSLLEQAPDNPDAQTLLESLEENDPP